LYETCPLSYSTTPLMFLRDILAVAFWRTETVQTHSRIVARRLFVVPKLNAFQGTFAEEIDDEVRSPRRNPVADHQLLRGAISEVNDEAVKKNSLAADPQLNRAKVNITAGDLDAAMVPTAVDLRIAQEVPKLATGEQGGGRDEDQESGNST